MAKMLVIYATDLVAMLGAALEALWDTICFISSLCCSVGFSWQGEPSCSPPVGGMKSNFDGCSLDNQGQIHISSMFQDHSQAAAKAFSKQANVRHAIAAEVLALLEDLIETSSLKPNDNLLMEDPTAVLSRPLRRKQGLRNRTSWGAGLQLGYSFFVYILFL